MTRLKKMAKPSSTTIPLNERSSAPQKRSDTTREATTPTSPTTPRCSLRSRGGRRSITRSRRAVTDRTSTGAMARKFMAGATRGVTSAAVGILTRREGRRRGGLGLDLADEGLHACLREAGERHRIDTDPDDEEQHRDQHNPLAHGEVEEPSVLLVRDLAEEHALVHPQQVDGGEDDAGGGEHRGDPAPLERAHEDEELAHEPVEAGEPDGREHDDHEERAERGHHLPDPPELLDEPRVAALVDHAHEEEE